jgi:hypothetical protein
MMNKEDLMFEVVIGMTIGLFIFVAFIKPVVDGIYQ